MNNSRRESGFTLIEVMIVVAIVGIIAAIALPSYQSSVRKSRRSDAHALLQAAQLAQEKFRLNNTSYAVTTDFTNAAFTGVCVTVGTQCRSQGGYYALTSTIGAGALAGVEYTLTATPVSSTSQAADTTCSTITVTQTASGVTNGPSTTCWSK